MASDGARLEDEIFDASLKLAGWLLAHQVDTAARGDSPMPVLCFGHDSLDSPQIVTTKASSDSYNDHVLAGRVLIADQGSEWSRWAFAYDEDLGPSGRALLVEVGGRESWEYVVRALDAVLTSLEVSKRGSEESQKVDGDSKPWLAKLWQKWRP
jgi:hypothetical protein